MFTEYLNAVQNLDDNISGVLNMLGEKKLLDNTVIIFTSDHGEGFGEVEKRSGHFGKYSLYTIRIPFWIYVPEKVLASHPGLREKLRANLDKNVSNNDIYPTILSFYGLEAGPSNRFGCSLLSEMDNGRDIYIFNGMKENRTDNRDYMGIIRKNDFFIAEIQATSINYYIYDLNDVYQSLNLWGAVPERDNAFLSSLHRENLEMFIKKSRWGIRSSPLVSDSN